MAYFRSQSPLDYEFATHTRQPRRSIASMASGCVTYRRGSSIFRLARHKVDVLIRDNFQPRVPSSPRGSGGEDT